jgi:hypothetical protein
MVFSNIISFIRGRQTTVKSEFQSRIDSDFDFPNGATVKLLLAIFETSATPDEHPTVPMILNALGACAGFAAQITVWRELILPKGRNPGDYLVGATTKSNEIFFMGESINQFLLATPAGRLSFLSLAAATLSNPAELCDIPDLLRHVVGTMGWDTFGQPRVPPSVSLPELPRTALQRTWPRVTDALRDYRPAEWPVLLGAAANKIPYANRTQLAPPTAVRILLEAAVPMSKLNPATVEQSGIQIPPLMGWSMRATQAEQQEAIMREVQSVMPVPSSATAAKPLAIAAPSIGFLNLGGPRFEAIAARDQEEIGPVFGEKVQTATSPNLTCDVLFLYCAFEPSGSVVGQAFSVRDIIGNSGARVAVLASEYPLDMFSNPSFRKNVERSIHPPVNLVVVGNRNGEAFGRFFKLLFQDMWNGVSMPLAWIKLAPHGPPYAPDIPACVATMEITHVVFVKG